MKLLDAIKRSLGSSSTSSSMQPPASPPAPEPAEIIIPEIVPADLMAERRNGHQPILLDCREDHEWRQVRIPGSLHIPMRQIPGRLAEIDRAADIVVVCAHGNRSYSVTGYLIENGFAAASLRGGVADWQARGGEVESDTTRATRS
jgi:rhodanese-related sulfurtransferase